MGKKHLVIPDCQVKPGIKLDYLKWVGRYVADQKPDTIICLGDFADMPSLSSYDKGKRAAEGRRYNKDIEATHQGMQIMLDAAKKARWAFSKARMVMCLGNHEERIMRHAEANPELHGHLGYHDLAYESYGWEVHDFLKPVVIDGITYVHFVSNPMTGKPYGGSVANILSKVGGSFVAGHKQGLELHVRHLPFTGKQQCGIISGSCYVHDEGYKGYQGNHHWRGLIVLHDVRDGQFDPMPVSMSYLKNRYGSR